MTDGHAFVLWLYDQRDASGAVAVARSWYARDRCAPTSATDGLAIVRHITERHVTFAPLGARARGLSLEQARPFCLAIAEAWDAWQAHAGSSTSNADAG